VTRRLALFAAALLALAVVYAVGWHTQPSAARPAAAPAGQTQAVTSVTRSCPPTPPGTGASRITMVAMPSQASSAEAGTAAGPAGTTGATGSATLSAVPAAPAVTVPGGKKTPASGATPTASGKPAAADGKPTAKPAVPVSVSAPGTVTTVTPPGGTVGGGTAVTATGQMAEGFEAEQATTAGTGLVSCSHPSSDMWFVGTGQGAGATDVWLYLMNTGSVTAIADVTILTDTGQQNGLNNAITVPPNQVVAENVTPFVTGSQALALQVQTSSGQVAASVWEGGNGGGAWLPQAAAPSTTLVIPGLTVASSDARLFVTVPGANVANVKVVALTPSGAVNQFPSAPVEASAGATTPVSLSALGASAAALKLTSNVPIVASVLVPGAGLGAFTTATAPVSGQGVVAGNPATKGDTVGLLLTAPAGAATATITVVGSGQTIATTTPAGGQVVTVASGRTLAVPVTRPPGGDPFAIVLTPRAGSGPLYAVRVVTSGTGGLSAPVSSLLPVANAPTTITLPPVDNSYTAVLPAAG
jgi:hypothetical protein